MEAIYFATFRSSGNEQSDRRKYVKENPSLLDFHNWIEEQREELRVMNNKEFIVLNINYFERALANES